MVIDWCILHVFQFSNFQRVIFLLDNHLYTPSVIIESEKNQFAIIKISFQSFIFFISIVNQSTGDQNDFSFTLSKEGHL